MTGRFSKMPENMSRSWIGDKSMELALDSFIVVTNPGSVFLLQCASRKLVPRMKALNDAPRLTVKLFLVFQLMLLSDVNW